MNFFRVYKETLGLETNSSLDVEVSITSIHGSSFSSRFVGGESFSIINTILDRAKCIRPKDNVVNVYLELEIFLTDNFEYIPREKENFDILK